jgi:hypothetical protein
MNVEDPKPDWEETGTTLPARLPWEAFGALAILILLVGNESSPILFRHSDWGFVYVTLRFIVVPVSSLVVGISSALRLIFSQRRAVLLRSGSVLVCGAAVYLSWIYQMPLFLRP